MIRPIGALLLSPLLLLGQTAPPAVPFAATSKLGWDAVTQDVRGNPETIGGYEIAVSGAGVDLNAGGVPLRTIVLGNVTEAPVSQLIVGLQDGPVRFWCRARDTAGTNSSWAMLNASIDTAAPKMPANLRIQITITVGP